MTVTRGEVKGDNLGGVGRVFRNLYKGHMDKTKGKRDQGWEVKMAGVGGSWGKWRQLYLNNNLKKRIASSETNSHIYYQLIFNKDTKPIQ